MCEGLYIAETPDLLVRHLFTTTMQPTVIQLAPVGRLIFSSANKQQRNSVDFNKEITLRYACFASKPCPLG